MVKISKLTKKRLGEILIEEGLLKEDQVNQALQHQKSTGELLGEVLVKLGYVSEYDIARTIARQFGLPYIDASRYMVSKDVVALFTREYLKANQFVPLDKLGKSLIVSIAGVLDQEVFEEIERKTGSQLFVYVSTAGQVAAVVDKFFPEKKATKVNLTQGQ